MQTYPTPAAIDGTRHDRRTNASTRNYGRELAYLRPHDDIQQVTAGTIPGTICITTASHGYLAVPMSHTWNREARYLCAYGYQGRLATYLEEDSEAPAFIARVRALEAKHHEQARRMPVSA